MSDAVLFHASDMPRLEELERLTQLRKPNQRWVYFVLENPLNSKSPSDRSLNSYFDWTLSYRLNSDIWMPYGRFESVSTPTNNRSINYAKNKTKQVAWLVSHCGMKRDRFVRKLEKYSIQVDVGGNCGKKFKSQLSFIPIEIRGGGRYR